MTTFVLIHGAGSDSWYWHLVHGPARVRPHPGCVARPRCGHGPAPRFLLCRDDRFFPAEFQRRVVKERLGIVPDEMGGRHLPALARPDELVAHLERYRREVADPH